MRVNLTKNQTTRPLNEVPGHRVHASVAEARRSRGLQMSDPQHEIAALRGDYRYLGMATESKG